MPYVLLVAAGALAALALLACYPPRAPKAGTAARSIPFISIPSESYVEFPPNILAEFWPAIRRFELDPARLTLRVGQHLPLQTVRVVAVDSSGTRFGQIAELELAVMSPIARLTDRGTIEGVAVGETILVIRPRPAPALQHLGDLPEWHLSVYVDPPVRR